MIRFLFSASANPGYLIFLRMSTGILAGLSFLSVWIDFQLLYSPAGMVDLELLQLLQPRPVFSVQKGIDYLQQHSSLDLKTIHKGIAVLYLGLCGFLTVGFLTRLSCLLLLLLHGAIFTALPQFSYGIDYFCSIALFYCLLFPTGHYGSIDRRLFQLSPSRWTGPCLRVLQLHLCLVYVFSGVEKMLGHTWRNGEAIWKTLHLPYFHQEFHLDVSVLAPYPWLFVLLGWSVVLTELLYPILIWLPQTRKASLSLIIMLHIGIALVLNLYLFSAMMITLNVAAFYFDVPAKEAPQPLAQSSSP